MEPTRSTLLLTALMLPMAAAAGGCEGDGQRTKPAAVPTTVPPPASAQPSSTASADAGTVADSGAADAGPVVADAAADAAASGVNAGCCEALRKSATTAPLAHKGAFLAAAAACDAVAASPDGREALVGVRAMLRGAEIPEQCR